jgi:hypothetical protein
VWPGEGRRAMVWLGLSGLAWNGSLWRAMVGLGEAWLAWSGLVRTCAARRTEARLGEVKRGRFGLEWDGVVRHE